MQKQKPVMHSVQTGFVVSVPARTGSSGPAMKKASTMCWPSQDLVPRRGLEPPRCYSLVPETSASTNSAIWAFQERPRLYSKKMTSGAQSAHLSDEIEGSVQGHRDGHGFVIRAHGQGDLYISPNEMRAVLHKDRVRARIVRQDRRGRPEGRVVAIIERPA